MFWNYWWRLSRPARGLITRLSLLVTFNCRHFGHGETDQVKLPPTEAAEVEVAKVLATISRKKSLRCNPTFLQAKMIPIWSLELAMH